MRPYSKVLPFTYLFVFVLCKEMYCTVKTDLNITVAYKVIKIYNKENIHIDYKY